METTRHFTGTVYVVHEGATLLHDHKRLDLWLPPGGHIDRDELPHRAALRETREETGLDVELVAECEEIVSPTSRSLPQPQHLQLSDINVFDGEVGHQHVDMVYYARAPGRVVDPAEGEVSAERWEWFTPEELGEERIAPDIAEIGRQAIETVDG